jgi:hypothetical protein
MSDDDSDDDYDNAHQIRGASNAKQAASNQWVVEIQFVRRCCRFTRVFEQ